MFSHFFIDRPIFASVLSIVIVIIGGVAFFSLPIAQYPEVTPPTVQVKANYPGASAKTVAETVATPIEQEINGVENMLYMSSKCTNDGQMILDVTFELGTDLDMAQVMVQNRVSIALPKVPEEVRRQGVTTKKRSPSILLCVNLISPDKSRNQLYLSNYATIQVKDSLARIEGVGDVSFLGARDYSMRVWLDPNELASRNMTATDVVNSLREQNVQVAAGRIAQPPVPAGRDFQYTINTMGRLIDADQFENIIVKQGEDGRITRLRDIGRAELGAKNYDVSSFLDGGECITLATFQLPGSNAVQTAQAIRAEMEKLKERFPTGVDYRIVYDTTIFIEESILSVYDTLIEAFILVFLVVMIFLQNWRVTIIPMLAVPVSLIGTFGVMAVLGFSLNNLSLLSLVLAIGVVVDDAIVVVENVEANIARGLAPREAARRAMTQVSGAIVATTLVMVAVFIPCAFIAGISGQFYRQFALTIAVSTVISAFNSLTLSPAYCALLLKPHDETEHGGDHEHLPRLGVVLVFALGSMYLLTDTLLPLIQPLLGDLDLEESWAPRLVVGLAGAVVGFVVTKLVNLFLHWFFTLFNVCFDFITKLYTGAIALLVRISLIGLAVYGGLMFLTYVGFNVVPGGFIPDQDKGYLVVNAQLPEGANVDRSEAVVARLTEIAMETEGVEHVIGIPGYSVLTSTNISNVGGMFVILGSFEERVPAGRSGNAIAAELRAKFREVLEAQMAVFGAPPVDGLGSTGGFKLQVQDRASSSFAELEGAVKTVAEKGNAQPGLVGLFSSFSANQPQLYADIDRTKAKSAGVPLKDLFDTLQIYLGSMYANDFTRFGRNWQVNVQADSQFRVDPEDIGRLKVRNLAGEMVPLGTLVTVEYVSGPAIVNRYNMYPSAEISGNTAPGFSSGQAIELMEQLCANELPSSMGFEWTELTLLQILAGNTAVFVFVLGTVFVFLTLSAQYESWSMPLAIILIVPMCLFAAITGMWLVGQVNDIFCQIGFVVLIGLAAKNAILIVEFARQREDEENEDRFNAATEACRLRIRPILMTSFAFVLGVVPLVTASGAGAEMRTSLGLAVFSGMLGVTIFGLFFTPIFYVFIRGFTVRREARIAAGSTEPPAAAPQPTDGQPQPSAEDEAKVKAEGGKNEG